ncbi:MAG: hypothetical protein KJ638_10790 [Chloroflexi bacterium]|nr:hypothetical protein [Chloroflexota bacterium]
MKSSYYLTEEELVQKALGALIEALGPIETTRFLSLPHTRRLESVDRHHRWQATLDQEKFFEQVFGPEETGT